MHQSRYLEFAHHENCAEEHLAIVLDESPSMDGTDFRPSRLGAAFKALEALLGLKAEKHPEDRVLVVAFSKKAELKSLSLEFVKQWPS